MTEAHCEFELSKLELAKAIRKFRIASDLSNKQLALQLQVSASMLSKIENGHRVPKEELLHHLCDVLSLANIERERLILLQRSLTKHHKGVNAPVLKTVNGQQLVSQYEERANTIRSCTPFLLPGLLQTNDYTRSVFSSVHWAKPPQGVEQQLTLRMERQARLYNREQSFHFVIPEDVLNLKKLLDDVAIVEQLQTLMMRTRLPNVHLGIVSSDVITTFLYPWFTTYDEEVLEFENIAGISFLYSPAHIYLYKGMFEDLSQQAIYDDEARQLIQQKLDTAQKNILSSEK